MSKSTLKKIKKLFFHPKRYFIDYISKHLNISENNVRLSENFTRQLYTQNLAIIDSIVTIGLKLNKLSPDVSSGKELWEYVDSKKNIESIYYVYMEHFDILFKGRFCFFSERNFSNKTDLIIMHGRPSSKTVMQLISKSLEYSIPIIFSEPSFILSIQIPAYYRNRQEYRFACSEMLDAVSHYYDATTPTSMECELNSDYVYSKEEIIRARNLIHEIVKNGITKYNNQPILSELKKELNSESIVLVIDQACNDWSIKLGYADSETFINMLDAAIEENPNSLILVKVHPDMIDNPNRGKVINKHLGHYTDYIVKEHDKARVKFLATYANPYSVIDIAEKVYVCTSQFGFEAMMSGKEVHIWGSPFYAGWGLGVQRSSSPAIDRRKKKHTIEEIFVTSYLNFSRYINPLTYEICELEELLKSIVFLRERFFENQNHVKSSFSNYTEPKLDEEIPIVFATDSKSLAQTQLAIRSLLQNDLSNKYYVYVISENKQSDDFKEKIRACIYTYKNLAGLEFIVPQDFKFNKKAKNFSENNKKYLKFEIHKILKNRKKVVYSDTNVIFFSGLSGAWRDFSYYKLFIGACADLDLNLADAFRKDETRMEVWNRYFEFSRGQYINGNFLLLNLESIRDSGLERVWEQYYSNDIMLNDTDIMFLSCKPKIYYLSTRYAISDNFDIFEPKYAELLNRYFPPEEKTLVEKLPVAVQYSDKYSVSEGVPVPDYPRWRSILSANN